MDVRTPGVPQGCHQLVWGRHFILEATEPHYLNQEVEVSHSLKFCAGMRRPLWADASDGHAALFEVIWVKKGSEVQIANS